MIDCKDLVNKRVVAKTLKLVYQGLLISYSNDTAVLEINNQRVIVFRIKEIYQDLYC